MKRILGRIIIPVAGFASLVSIGFGAWVFNESLKTETDLSAKVNITALNSDLGTLVINDGEDYTAEGQYYTLVFAQDQDLDEDVGVTLYPDIEYTFSSFKEEAEGYAYYIYYQTEYASDSIYASYVEMVGSASSTMYPPTTGESYQTSAGILVDTSSKTLMPNTDDQYTMTGTLSTSFKWKSWTKPTNEASYNSFLNTVNSSSDTFNIVIWITYEKTGA